MRVIIAGSTVFNDYNLFREECNNLLKSETDIEVVIGNSKGADQLGERYAIEKSYAVKKFPLPRQPYGDVPWEYGTYPEGSDSYNRHEQMCDYADALISFWDGKSRGAKRLIDFAKQQGLDFKVIALSLTQRGDEYVWIKRGLFINEMSGQLLS